MTKRRADGPPVTRRPNKPKKSRGQRVRGLLKTLAIFGLVGVLILVGVFFVLYKAIEIPEPNEAFEAQTTFVYYSGGKDELGTYYDDQNRQSIPLSEMPQSMQDAVVAAENRTFWTDKGLDPKGILRAAFSNAQGNAQQGASTITQQYVKILYLTSERSYQRKVKEAIVSLKIQNQLSKSQILEGYLNTIYFGRGAYGIQAAAQAFFAKDAKDLSLRESAVLATTLNNPSRYDPDNGREAKQALKERYGYILDGMADMGTITAEEAEKAQKRLPKFPRDRQPEPVRRAEGSHADPGEEGAAAPRLRRAGDRRRRPAGHHHVHRGRHGGRRAGRARAEARGLRRQGAARRRGHGRGGHRRAARLLRRPGLSRLADQLGRPPAARAGPR